MPKRKKRTTSKSRDESASENTEGLTVRALWSGTITFGLVSIPVDLMSAVRPRQTAMKLIDQEGHALGRQYRCSKEGKELNYDDLIRGYETEDGTMVPITDEEFESVSPEMSADINLRNFVDASQIPPTYFQKPYFLAPAGKSARAYTLLAATMERTARVGIGSFVMRDHEYLVAIVADNGVLRADTLRYEDEVRTPESIGLGPRKKPSTKTVGQFAKEIDGLTRKELSMAELEDKEADELQALVNAKQKDGASVIHQPEFETDEAEGPAEGGGQVIDFMEVLRRSLSRRATVQTAQDADSGRRSSAPISLDERRAAKQAATGKSAATKKTKTRKSRKRTGA